MGQKQILTIKIQKIVQIILWFKPSSLRAFSTVAVPAKQLTI